MFCPYSAHVYGPDTSLQSVGGYFHLLKIWTLWMVYPLHDRSLISRCASVKGPVRDLNWIMELYSSIYVS